MVCLFALHFNIFINHDFNYSFVAFQPFEQLHEAVLAAVNSNTLPPNFMAAAAAVAAAAAMQSSSNHGTPIPTDHEQQQQQQQGLVAAIHNMDPNAAANQQNQQILELKPLPEVDQLKKESVRASNRERKKKWRIHNEERSMFL